MRSSDPGWVALALHLSRLPPPAPRPHHRRIARAVLDDAAARQGGPLLPARQRRHGPALPGGRRRHRARRTLARLFAVPMRPTPNCCSRAGCWPTEADAVPRLCRLREQEAAARPPPPAITDPAPSHDRARSHVRRGRECPHHRSAAPADRRPGRGGHARASGRFFARSPSRSPRSRPGPQAGGHATADPFLFRHLRNRLDGRMLEPLADDLARTDACRLGARQGGRSCT